MVLEQDPSWLDIVAGNIRQTLVFFCGFRSDIVFLNVHFTW
jgi:hypothetical protein